VGGVGFQTNAADALAPRARPRFASRRSAGADCFPSDRSSPLFVGLFVGQQPWAPKAACLLPPTSRAGHTVLPYGPPLYGCA
jgi:hypothetical protein